MPSALAVLTTDSSMFATNVKNATSFSLLTKEMGAVGFLVFGKVSAEIHSPSDVLKL